MKPVPRSELDAGLDTIRAAPKDDGQVRLIARRPAVDEREVLSEGVLDTERGLVGDTWSERSTPSTEDGSPHPGKQITMMNARVAALIASSDRWQLAGDQLYVDFDLSTENLPPGSRLAIGEAVLEISPEPHRGCKKFSNRFGVDALRFVNSEAGRELRLRGVNTKVVVGGVVRTGDPIRKL